jgi:uncharacterized protein
MKRFRIKAPSSAASRFIIFLTGMILISLIGYSFSFDSMGPMLFAIYFMFGFLLQRGTFCGAALISSVVLLKEYRGLIAIALSILTAMLGLAVLSKIGWITANPRKLELLPAIVGGTLFGVGMVLAGGCISGSLFKATELRFNSILAVIGIFIGIALIGKGPGARFRQMLSDTTNDLSIGPSLADLIGISYTKLGILVALIGIVLFIFFIRNQKRKTKSKKNTMRISLGSLSERGWSMIAVGVGIGILSWPVYFASQRLGVTYGFGAAKIPASLLQLVIFNQVKIVGLIAWSFIVGSALSAWLRGDMIFRSADRETLIFSFVGGLLVGSGAVIGWGCFVGNMLTGWALLSIHSLVFGITMVSANWITTIFYMRGW